MHYVDKKEFNEIFHLKKLINNDFLKVLAYDEYFYAVHYDEVLYRRFIRILKLSYHPGIDKYIKIIKYCKKHDKGYEEVLSRTLSEELAKSIDKQIVNDLLKMKNKDTI